MTSSEQAELDEQDQSTDEATPETGWTQIPCLRGIYEVEPLFDLCDKHGGRMIGGYPRFCCSPAQRVVPAGDVDIFPIGTTQEESKKVYSDLHAALLTAGLKPKHENNVSITFDSENRPAPYSRCPAIQLIKPIREGAIVTDGTVEEILSNFDFTVVRVALNPDRKTATAWASFPKDEQRHMLRILNIHCPISSLLRVLKYGRKGYYMRPYEALQLFLDWQNRTPEYRERIADLFTTSKLGKMSQKEIDELEALLRVD